MASNLSKGPYGSHDEVTISKMTMRLNDIRRLPTLIVVAICFSLFKEIANDLNFLGFGNRTEYFLGTIAETLLFAFGLLQVYLDNDSHSLARVVGWFGFGVGFLQTFVILGSWFI